MASERMVSTICEYFTFTIHLQIAKNTKLHVYFTENCVQASMGNYWRAERGTVLRVLKCHFQFKHFALERYWTVYIWGANVGGAEISVEWVRSTACCCSCSSRGASINSSIFIKSARARDPAGPSIESAGVVRALLMREHYLARRDLITKRGDERADVVIGFPW